MNRPRYSSKWLLVTSWAFVFVFLSTSVIFFVLWRNQVVFTQNCLSQASYDYYDWMGKDWVERPPICNDKGPVYDNKTGGLN